MTTPTTLNGITWNHTRGYVPMVATAQRFGETHVGTTIHWQTRSLQEFADYPIEKLAENFDLLVIDHPFVGYAAAHPVLLPLDEWLPADFLADQQAHSVGQSHPSYQYGGHQWALAIDAATPVSSYRPDLLLRFDVEIPRTWEDMMALARRGLVALPAIPVDSLMHFFMLCCAVGEEPGTDEHEIVGQPVGVEALEHLRELVGLCAPQCLQRNPIATYEMMASTDEVAYCPFAYGYSNYARDGYARHLLRFGGLVEWRGKRLRSTLGGTGLAISCNCQNVELAVEYARFVADPLCQQEIYFMSGGQPGYRDAWENSVVNAISHFFFQDTLEALDEAYVRPRYNGYLDFQDAAGTVVHDYLQQGGDPTAVLTQLNTIYRESRQGKAT